MMADYNTNYLVHHGIKGQKWGVRRFQNLDGSLTAMGSKRYESQATRNTVGNKEQYRKNVELDKKITAYNSRHVGTGKQIIKNILLGQGGQMTYNMARAAGEGRGKAFVRSIFDINLTRGAGNLAGAAASGAVSKLTYKPGDDDSVGTVLQKAARTSTAANIAGTVSSRVVDRVATGAAYKRGAELSLQQRALRKKYGGGYKVK